MCVCVCVYIVCVCVCAYDIIWFCNMDFLAAATVATERELDVDYDML